MARPPRCLDKMGGCTTSKNAVAVVADGGRSTDLKKAGV